MTTKEQVVEPQFWERIAPAASNECWLWTGYIEPTGYARYGGGKKHGTQLAHRIAYEQIVGPIPEGLQLDHLCRVRHCVNPWRLDPVPPVVNVRRGVASLVQLSKTHCPRGHEYSDGNTYRVKGQRHCRECKRIASRKAATKRRGRVVDSEYRVIRELNLSNTGAHNKSKTHCPQGHPYDETNTGTSNGHRTCKTCRREAARAKRQAA